MGKIAWENCMGKLHGEVYGEIAWENCCVVCGSVWFNKQKYYKVYLIRYLFWLARLPYLVDIFGMHKFRSAKKGN